MRGHNRHYTITRITRHTHDFRTASTDLIFMYTNNKPSTVIGATLVDISRKDVARVLWEARSASHDNTTYTVERYHNPKHCFACR